MVNIYLFIELLHTAKRHDGGHAESDADAELQIRQCGRLIGREARGATRLQRLDRRRWL